MIVLPSIAFSPWRPWAAVGERPWKGLNETGAYLLARFPGSPPTGPAEPTAPEIFYIGEAHGRTSCLRNRLKQFGDSAGFWGRQKNGHYAAWDYPERFPQDKSVSPRNGEPVIKSDRVFVAVCSYSSQPNWPRDARGVFPVLAESSALWLYVIAQGGLPALNNSGWQGRPHDPAIPSNLSAEVESLVFQEPGMEKKANCVIELLADALGYKPARKLYESKFDEWTEVERHLGAGLWLGLGWKGSGPNREFCLDLYDGDEPLLCLPDDKTTIKTHRDVMGMLDRFWTYWHQPLPTETGPSMPRPTVRSAWQVTWTKVAKRRFLQRISRSAPLSPSQETRSQAPETFSGKRLLTPPCPPSPSPPASSPNALPVKTALPSIPCLAATWWSWWLMALGARRVGPERPSWWWSWSWEPPTERTIACTTSASGSAFSLRSTR